MLLLKIWKRSAFISIPKKEMIKNAQGIVWLHSFHASKVMLSSMWTERFLMNKLDLEKQRNQRSNWQHSLEFQKNTDFCFIDYAKAFVWITANCGKFLKRWEYQITLPVPWENEGQKQQWEWDMEQRIGSKLGKDYFKAVYCYPAYLTSM